MYLKFTSLSLVWSAIWRIIHFTETGGVKNKISMRLVLFGWLGWWKGKENTIFPIQNEIPYSTAQYNTCTIHLDYRWAKVKTVWEKKNERKKKKALVPYDRRHIARAAELKAAPKGDGSHRKGPALTRSREYIKELDPDLSVRRKHFKKKKVFTPCLLPTGKLYSLAHQ